MHWYVLGTGAMGCLLATHIERQGVSVTLLPRHDPASPAPLTVQVGGLGGDRTCRLPWEPIAAATPISHLLVMTKACDVEVAVGAVAPRLSARSVIVLLSNGMGFAERLQARWPALNLTFGTTTEGAYREGPWQVVHAGRGSTRIGRQGVKVAPDWFASWQQALPDCRWDPAIEEALWRKLAINCAINPLTALYGCRNGELARDPVLATEVRALCEEITRVGAAAGHGSALNGLERRVFEVVTATAANRSSMLQDVSAGRPTEIDYINGYLLRVAERCGVPAPRNRALVRALRARARPAHPPGAPR